jgi:GR25 family glycosyltransferase involved in LPS biosynthesis
MEDRGHALILEDDAVLGPIGFNSLSQMLDSSLAGIDLIFLNALITSADFIFIRQYQIYRRMVASKGVAFLDPRGLYAAGADAYIVNKDSKEKLLELLESVVQFDVPYDLLLKEWMESGKLQAKLTLPFLTSLSVLADDSQITGSNPDWNRFRRLYALDSEFHLETQANNGVPHDRAVDLFTDEHLKFLKILLTRYASYD